MSSTQQLTEKQLFVVAAVLLATSICGSLFSLTVPWSVLLVGVVVGAWGVSADRMLLVVIGLLALLGMRLHQENTNYELLGASDFVGVVEIADVFEIKGPAFATGLVELQSGEFAGKRLSLTAAGAPMHRMARLSIGDRANISGDIRPIRQSAWNKSRHIVGRLQVNEFKGAVGTSTARSLARVAEERVDAVVRRADPDNRDLLRGLIVGDDSGQRLSEQVVFRAAGLSHLLVVSGQNVAFVILIVSFLARFASRRTKLIVSCFSVVLFAQVTRFEPSVLRASVMALALLVSYQRGSRLSGVGLLAVAVICLLLIDPFIGLSLSFQLSASATLGIILTVERLDRLGLRNNAIVSVAAVTMGAQCGVLPLLMLNFGSPSPSIVIANLAASWAAGAAMATGVALAIGSAFLPAWMRWPAHQVLDLLIDYLQLVASVASQQQRAFSWLVIVLVGLIGVKILRGLTLALFVATLTLLVGVQALGEEPALGPSFEVVQTDEGVLIFVQSSVTSSEVFELSRSVPKADVLVSESGSRQLSEQMEAIAELVKPRVVYAPKQHSIGVASRLKAPLRFNSDSGRITIEELDGKLVLVREEQRVS